ncbi:hypothetical protein [Pseudoalteromonas umbrosa]|uniref:hypothetical protein n=1 Tax=Pseudoalteromonas umbrosa TaxID=3048489 RepID=UPI0024C406F7|nr:hypothetical protein [Pseudoalteromonas sp. B95]MDK1285598.1 hypothetical protein [Pseudoalteromonas sp. B95]
MLAELTELDDHVKKLEAHCQAGELESAEEALTKVDFTLKRIFSSDDLDLSTEQVEHLKSCYENISAISDKLRQQKGDVTSQLSQHIGNKKKINVYKSI